MWKPLSSLSIKSKLEILVAAFVAGLIIFWFGSQATIDSTKVKGSLYEEIVRDKDLLEEIQPPPLCLLEAHLIANQMSIASNEDARQRLSAKYQQVKSSFLESIKKWSERDIYPATRSVLEKQSNPSAKAYFEIFDRLFLPAIRRNEKREAEKILETQLDPIYASHREAIDELVARASQGTSVYEQEAEDVIRYRTNLLFFTAVVVVVIGCLLAYCIFGPILRQMKSLILTLKSVASGDLNNRMDNTCTAEFAELSDAINEMISSLVDSKMRADMACQSKSEFLANMSHEIRTPLTAILGYCDVLRDDGVIEHAPPRRIQTIATIRRAGEHLLTVINDILDLSKIEAGKLTTEQVEMDLPRILLEVESLIRPRMMGKQLELRTRLQTPIPTKVMSDPTRLRQILLNLVGNAVKFTEKGIIEVRVRIDRSKGQSRLFIEVEDTGAGMTEEQAEMLFRPFTQADASVTRKFGGTGLGLTISRRLAQMMGGDVILDFTEPELGTRFVVELPLNESPHSVRIYDLNTCTLNEALAVDAHLLSVSGRILLAEDSEDNQFLISLHLRKAGAIVEIADNGRIALEKINAAIEKSQPYDLLITDIQMPEMDGYTLAETLRAMECPIPIIALTAHAMPEDKKKCLDAGCSDYLSKPINKPQLITTCSKWLKKSDGRSSVRAPHNEIQRRSLTALSPNATNNTLTSELADDPEMAPLVAKFVGNLDHKIDTMNSFIATNQLSELVRMAHQLSGAGGGYGFPRISDAARRLEASVTPDPDMKTILEAMTELSDLCQQAAAGAKITHHTGTDQKLAELLK